MVNAESDPEGQARVAAFRSGLQQLGWAEGQSIRIDYHWGISEPGRAQTRVAEVVKLAPDVIVANGTPALAALRRATSSIPVVFVVVTDPVGAGYVQSLARPGGNVTGFSTFEPEIGSKWLELLREMAPGLARAITTSPARKLHTTRTSVARKRLGIQVIIQSAMSTGNEAGHGHRRRER